ncbi:MAG TPA: thiol protease/hemagglutinin PrtT [Bacteroidales bacterium]|nr:thiol protease/hemagglutinin PrtT [Bacteroidales bacterium]
MKKVIITIILLFTFTILNAEPVSKEFARTIAGNYYMHYAPPAIKDYSINNEFTFQNENTTTFYAFGFSAGGFVLVSADDAAIPVLGYSFQDDFSSDNLPSNVQDWLQSYSKEIKSIIDLKISNNSTLVEWNNFLNNNFPKALAAVSPLLSTTWNQDCYYNASCPSDASGPCSHVYAGCVATAMAQIMKYWEWPVTGNGSHTYTHATYGTQSANYGATTYNWGAMPDDVTSSNSSVAILLKHCGVSVDMNYGWDGSGAYSSDIPDALINYFGYQNTATYVYQSDYSSAAWISLLKSELDAGRPMEYSGNNGSSGHAFVCDGYNSSNYFHFNWGWSGSYNGYFYIGALDPGSHAFDYDNAAVIHIAPSTVSPSLDCNGAINLSCGQTYNGSTVSGNSNVSTYGCISWNESGPEIVHKITIGTGDITATLSNMTSDLDVFILGSCSISDCLASGDNDATISGASAGTYYIVVDGYNGASDSYSLNVTCTSPALNCSGAINLTCGQNYNGSTVSSNSNVSSYSGSAWDESGPEKVHKLTISSSKNLIATLSNLGGVDLDVFILSACNALACQTSGDNSATFNNAPAGTYYFVVDGYNGASGSYTLNVTCQSDGTGIDDLTNDKSIQIYPNPAERMITIENSNFQENQTLTIFNIQGQLLMQQPLLQPKTEIDISFLKKGVYFIKVSNEADVLIKKFIKE